MPTESDHKGALDITILEDGWGDVLLVGWDGTIYTLPVTESAWRYGSPTTFELFNASDANFHRIESSWIHDLIFLGTSNKGLGICNPTTREVRFINTTHDLPHNSVNYLKVRGNYLLIGTQGGFAIYDLISEELFSWTEDDYAGTLNVGTMEYYHVSQTVYIGNSDGLFVFERNGDSFAPAGGRMNTNDGLHGDQVYSLEIEESSETLYIGTKNGVSIVDIDSDEIEIESLIDSRWLSGYKVLQIVIRPSYNYIYLGTSDNTEDADRNNWVGGSLIRIPVNFKEIILSLEYYVNVSLIAGIFILGSCTVWLVHIHKRRNAITTRKPDFAILDSELNAEQVEKIIYGGENHFVEFKSSFYWDYKAEEKGAPENRCINDTELPFQCIETIAGFMNAEGGILLIGVNNLGEKLGLENDFRHIMKRKDSHADSKDQFLLRIRGKMESHKIDFKFQRKPRRYFPEGLEKDICVVQVEPSSEPVWLRNVKGYDVLPVRDTESTIQRMGREATDYIHSHWSQSGK